MNAEALDSYLRATEARRRNQKNDWPTPSGICDVELARVPSRAIATRQGHWDGWHWDAFSIAGLSAEVGDKAGALDWLERAFRASIRVPGLDTLRNPAFHLLDANPDISS